MYAKTASLDVVKKVGYSGADVARFLGMNTSAVNRLAVSDESAEVEKYVSIVMQLRYISKYQRVTPLRVAEKKIIY